MSQFQSDYLGVILAAGRGSRMSAFSEQYPKPILPIENCPLIVHQIELMKSLGINEIVILIGHKGYIITSVLGDGSYYDVKLHYVEQSKILGIAHALGQLESYIDRPFLLFLGDIFFEPKNLENIFKKFEEQKGGAVLATKIENNLEAIRRNYAVQLNDDGRVIKVIEKPRHVINNLKGVGLYLFDLHIFDAIRRTPRTAMRDEYEITDAIQVMIDDGHAVGVANTVQEDLNLTFPNDLLRLNMKRLKDGGKDFLIGENTVIHPNALIENSIIGNNVEISEPIEVRNTLIFNDVTLKEKRNCNNMIITPYNSINCGSYDHDWSYT
jgi:dTDP-glucose pyrophosphorylase